MENKLYKLTNPQKNIWYTEEYFKGTPINNICGSFIINEKTDLNILNSAINYFIQNNDSFKLRFKKINGELNQYFANDKKYKFEILNIEKESQIEVVAKKQVQNVFDLLKSKPFEFKLFKLKNGFGGFIVNCHHIISDATTISIMATEIINNYYNLLNNYNIINKSCSYVDYIDSENKYMESEQFKKSKDFWLSQFDLTTFSYLTDKTTTSPYADRLNFTLSKTFCDNLSKFCKKTNISKFNVFMSALSIYLAKINNVTDTIIGTPVLNRLNKSQKNTSGMFISTIPFKTHIDQNQSYLQYLLTIKNNTFSYFRHQKYPYSTLLNDIRKKTGLSNNLYDVALSYQNARDNSNTSKIKYTTKWIFNGTVSNNMDIHIYDMDNTGKLNISYDYKKDLFNTTTVSLLHNRLIGIINQLLLNPDTPIKNIEIVCSKEKDYIFNRYNKPNTSTSKKIIPVIKMFEKQEKLTPNNLAICFNDKKYTYRELNCLANNLAFILEKKGVKPNDNICLFLGNSIELVVSILAILKIGACYVPIDVKYPKDRIDYIYNNSSAKYILTNTNCSGKLDKSKKSILIDLNKLNPTFQKKFNTKSVTNNQLAYIIYTSGSTGKPKGVTIKNKSLSNYINFCVEKYVGNKTANFPLYSSIAFDLTVTSIYTPLVSGNAIYIYEHDNPQLLMENIVSDNKVQVIKLTPAHLNLLLNTNFNHSSIKKLIVGGDLLGIELCKQISNYFSHRIHIYNEYGPTEATVGCMIYEYSDKKNYQYSSLPIGVPINNVKIYLLDKNLSLVPCDQIGEMYIGGDCLSNGYLNLDDRNKESFVISPFNKKELLYKTGDLAKLYYNDTMEYLGRTDFQVKLNGYRIEIGEIQSNLLKHRNIKDSYITVNEINGQKMLCAYYVSKNNIAIPNLDEYLSKTLPLYMIPKHYIKLDIIPLTINGKIDKKKLPLPEINTETYEEPKNETELLLQQVFSKMIRIQKNISVSANFFDYYIDSLTIIKIQTILYSYGININTQLFYEYKTIRALSNYITNNQNTTSTSTTNHIQINTIRKKISNKFPSKNLLLLGASRISRYTYLKKYFG